jgi:hypothetical protein
LQTDRIVGAPLNSESSGNPGYGDAVGLSKAFLNFYFFFSSFFKKTRGVILTKKMVKLKGHEIKFKAIIAKGVDEGFLFLKRKKKKTLSAWQYAGFLWHHWHGLQTHRPQSTAMK